MPVSIHSLTDRVMFRVTVGFRVRVRLKVGRIRVRERVRGVVRDRVRGLQWDLIPISNSKLMVSAESVRLGLRLIEMCGLVKTRAIIFLFG
jgi:hypothetical protein